jgi:hypothetical protein
MPYLAVMLRCTWPSASISRCASAIMRCAFSILSAAFSSRSRSSVPIFSADRCVAFGSGSLAKSASTLSVLVVVLFMSIGVAPER